MPLLVFDKCLPPSSSLGATGRTRPVSSAFDQRTGRVRPVAPRSWECRQEVISNLIPNVSILYQFISLIY